MQPSEKTLIEDNLYEKRLWKQYDTKHNKWYDEVNNIYDVYPIKNILEALKRPILDYNAYDDGRSRCEINIKSMEYEPFRRVSISDSYALLIERLALKINQRFGDILYRFSDGYYLDLTFKQSNNTKIYDYSNNTELEIEIIRTLIGANCVLDEHEDIAMLKKQCEIILQETESFVMRNINAACERFHLPYSYFEKYKINESNTKYYAPVYSYSFRNAMINLCRANKGYAKLTWIPLNIYNKYGEDSVEVMQCRKIFWESDEIRKTNLAIDKVFIPEEQSCYIKTISDIRPDDWKTYDHYEIKRKPDIVDEKGFEIFYPEQYKLRQKSMMKSKFIPRPKEFFDRINGTQVLPKSQRIKEKDIDPEEKTFIASEEINKEQESSVL